jgi:hypothetical protein
MLGRGTKNNIFCFRSINRHFVSMKPIPGEYDIQRGLKYTEHCTSTQGWGGGSGGVEPKRRLEGQQFTKLGRKCKHDCLYLRSINTGKHLLQGPFTGRFV